MTTTAASTTPTVPARFVTAAEANRAQPSRRRVWSSPGADWRRHRPAFAVAYARHREFRHREEAAPTKHRAAASLA